MAKVKNYFFIGIFLLSAGNLCSTREREYSQNRGCAKSQNIKKYSSSENEIDPEIDALAGLISEIIRSLPSILIHVYGLSKLGFMLALDVTGIRTLPTKNIDYKDIKAICDYQKLGFGGWYKERVYHLGKKQLTIITSWGMNKRGADGSWFKFMCECSKSDESHWGDSVNWYSQFGKMSLSHLIEHRRIDNNFSKTGDYVDISDLKKQMEKAKSYAATRRNKGIELTDESGLFVNKTSIKFFRERWS